MNADQLVAEFTRQRDRYRDLLELSREETRVVSSGDADSLIRFAERKRVILDEIGAIDRELAVWKREWKTVRPRLPADFVARVEGVVDDILVLLRELLGCLR